MNGSIRLQLLLTSALVGMCPLLARAQLRVVTYNTLSGGGNNPGLSTVLDAIGQESVNGIQRPIDVLILQEQSKSGSTQGIVEMLNGLYGAGTYARASTSPYNNSGMYVNLVYRADVLTLEDTRYFRAGGAPRDTGRYRLGLNGYGDEADLYIYNTHHKAGTGTSNEDRRADEAFAIRYNASYGSDNLPEGTSIIYAGDFNQKTSYEDGSNPYTGFYENPYEILRLDDRFGSGNGQAVDPVGRPGWWSDVLSFADLHTQAPLKYAPGGYAGGGMDDRFDFQMIATELNDGEGLSYIGPGVGDLSASQHSYRAFGNNGTHYINNDISTGTGASPAVLAALEIASDHLPVVADYQIPAKMSVDLAQPPPRVIVGASSSIDVEIANSADVVAVIGADELDYDLTTSGDLNGSASGSDDALGASAVHAVSLKAATAGPASGQVHVVSTSQAVADGSFAQTVTFDVLDHAEASFDADVDQDTLQLDLGAVAPGTDTVEQAFAIHNLLATAGYTAALDLDAVDASGDTASLTADLTPLAGLVAGASAGFVASLQTHTPGLLEAQYTLDVSDEDLPGAAAGTSLTLALTGYVGIAGDASLDKSVDVTDLAILSSHWQSESVGWAEGDFSGDGTVDVTDLANLAANWNASVASKTVPEPASAVVCILGLGAASMRRRAGPKASGRTR